MPPAGRDEPDDVGDLTQRRTIDGLHPTTVLVSRKTLVGTGGLSELACASTLPSIRSRSALTVVGAEGFGLGVVVLVSSIASFTW